MKNEKQRKQVKLSKSEIVALALLFVLKASKRRHFYRWLKRDYLPLFPNLPERELTQAGGNPSNVKICKRGTRNERMIVGSVFSPSTRRCQGKQMRHRMWKCFEMRLEFLLTIFNILQLWNELNIDEEKFTYLSMAKFAF